MHMSLLLIRDAISLSLFRYCENVLIEDIYLAFGTY